MDFRDAHEFLKDASKYIIVFVLVLLLFIFVIGLQQVVGPSMSPNYNEGDVLVVNKFSYKFRKPKRGEVVVVSAEEKYMIKRVIGIPGDRIEFKDNKLYINDQEYKESYLKDDVITNDFKLSDIGVEGAIPDGKYLVLGDNRTNSLDGRNYGLIDKKNIIGISWFRIWTIK
jgi:signal peptidase I